MSRSARRSLVAALAAAGGLLMLGGCAEQRAMSNDPAVEAACLRAAQRAAPGSYMGTGVQEQRTALYRSCMANGGTLPRAR
ncbi:hypothetical protein [Phreatobacter stygius]|uniref:Uncharacterized protein n=1 Tax=Phreatobacter stygius TaxID=1940610 RepID=A0A4D7BE79_9HYPH|nr:hypothetical protein [Phreatobacter stygius]QCI68268.1 hypothetical protein E8M01_31015 [Phreatobacter stygius]